MILNEELGWGPPCTLFPSPLIFPRALLCFFFFSLLGCFFFFITHPRHKKKRGRIKGWGDEERERGYYAQEEHQCFHSIIGRRAIPLHVRSEMERGRGGKKGRLVIPFICRGRRPARGAASLRCRSSPPSQSLRRCRRQSDEGPGASQPSPWSRSPRGFPRSRARVRA